MITNLNIKPLSPIVKQKYPKSEIKESNTHKVKNQLNPRHEKFCQLYARNRDLLGNGTKCYLEVYGYKDDIDGKTINYDAARANASRLLTNDNVLRRINELLETDGFTDENVDKQHLFLLSQFADLKTKLGAIKEYNSLKKRISRDNTGLNDLADLISENIRRRNDKVNETSN